MEKAEETPSCLQLYFDIVREAGTQLCEDKHNLFRGSHIAYVTAHSTVTMAACPP